MKPASFITAGLAIWGQWILQILDRYKYFWFLARICQHPNTGICTRCLGAITRIIYYLGTFMCFRSISLLMRTFPDVPIEGSFFIQAGSMPGTSCRFKTKVVHSQMWSFFLIATVLWFVGLRLGATKKLKNRTAEQQSHYNTYSYLNDVFCTRKYTNKRVSRVFSRLRCTL